MALCLLTFSGATAQKPTPLRLWFDTPTTLRGHAVWLSSDAKRNPTRRQLESAGDTPYNPDPEWEACSFPIGNGSIGGNVFGSVEAERITFNEKTLWRGGPNTSKGAAYYWNVNKQSAPVIAKIREAFARGDWKEAARLTQKNFNSEVPYEATAEDPFRFGSFTTAGEFCVETGLSAVGMTRYRRELSLDSAIVNVSFTKDDVDYRREFFVSYPANVMVVRFTASQRGKQNLTLRYLPDRKSVV